MSHVTDCVKSERDLIRRLFEFADSDVVTKEDVEAFLAQLQAEAEDDHLLGWAPQNLKHHLFDDHEGIIVSTQNVESYERYSDLLNKAHWKAHGFVVTDA